jgi:alpha-D-ribose 1-methylphosphonate 5-triphosphate synthase subunit PhnL
MPKNTMTNALLKLTDVSKHFTLHHQNGAVIPVLDRVNFSLEGGQCLVLDGPSGMGKSTLLKLIYANYSVSSGRIELRQPDGTLLRVDQASPRELIKMRRDCVGYVSQFLRVIPRVSALDVVAEPLIQIDPGATSAQTSKQIDAAGEQARVWLARLRIPERLWHLPPATFSGGEQQRINIARNMIKPRPLLLLDEPTASLDAQNISTVIELIQEALRRGTAVAGIFHDAAVRDAVATRRMDMSEYRMAA